MLTHPFLGNPFGGITIKTFAEKKVFFQSSSTSGEGFMCRPCYPIFNQCSFSIPLKTSKTLQFLDFFRRYRSGALLENGLSISSRWFPGPDMKEITIWRKSCFPNLELTSWGLPLTRCAVWYKSVSNQLDSVASPMWLNL